MRRRDKLAAHNERTKLGATTVNALGLAIAAIGVLQPLMDEEADRTWWIVLYIVVALALHGIAHYIVSQVEIER